MGFHEEYIDNKEWQIEENLSDSCFKSTLVDDIIKTLKDNKVVVL